MKAKQLLVWLLVLAAAAAAYYLSEMAADKSEQAEQAAKKVVRLKEPLQVQRVEFSGKDYAKPIRIERRPKEHRWVITQPLEYPADNLMVGALIDRLFAARSRSALQDPGPLSEYGLEKPAVKLTLMDAQGFKSELILGDKTPDGSRVYAKLGHNRDVLLLPAGEKSQFAKNLFDLRDKTALDFILSDVSKVELSKGDKSIVLKRKKGGVDSEWEFADGVEASSEEVESLLSRVHALKAKGFQDQGFDLAKLGLEPAQASLKLTMSDKGKTKSDGLLLGGPAPKGVALPMRRISGGPVMQMDQGAKEIWAQTRFNLTERRIFRVERNNIDSLEIVQNGKKLAFAKKDGDWQRTEPKGEKQDGDACSMFTWDLADLKWQKVLNKAENLLAKPRAVIKFSLRASKAGDDGKAESKNYMLTIGQKDAKTGLLAVKAEGNDSIYGIKSEFWDKMPVYPKAK